MSRACHRPKSLSPSALDSLREKLQAEYPPPQGWSEWQEWRHYGGTCLVCRKGEWELRLMPVYDEKRRVVIIKDGKGFGLADSPSEAWKKIDETDS